MTNIKSVLEMWGSWARCSIGTEYKSVAAGFQDMPSTGSPALLMKCDDSEGMRIDAAVAGLRHFDSLAYKLVIAHYVYRISQTKLAKQLSKSQGYVSSILRVAEAFIAGQMFVETGETFSVE